MSILGAFCAPVNTLGTTLSKLPILALHNYHSMVHSRSRVRAGIRDGHNSYCVMASSWPMFLYAGLTCDQDDLEKGLFKGSLLVKVSTLLLYLDILVLIRKCVIGLQVRIYVPIICYCRSWS
jgi:hypothetical protein